MSFLTKLIIPNSLISLCNFAGIRVRPSLILSFETWSFVIVYLITLPSREVIEELAAIQSVPLCPLCNLTRLWPTSSTLANVRDVAVDVTREPFRLRNLRDYAMVLNDHDQNLQNDRSILKSLYL